MKEITKLVSCLLHLVCCILFVVSSSLFVGLVVAQFVCLLVAGV